MKGASYVDKDGDWIIETQKYSICVEFDRYQYLNGISIKIINQSWIDDGVYYEEIPSNLKNEINMRPENFSILEQYIDRFLSLKVFL